MAASILGLGGKAIIANTAAAAASAVVLYDRDGAYGADADGGNFNVYTVEHTGTSDGTTSTTDRVVVQVIGKPNLHGATTAATAFVAIAPGERMAFNIGLNYNNIMAIRAWLLNAAMSGAAGGSVLISGGGMSQT